MHAALSDYELYSPGEIHGTPANSQGFFRAMPAAPLPYFHDGLDQYAAYGVAIRAYARVDM